MTLSSHVRIWKRYVERVFYDYTLAYVWPCSSIGRLVCMTLPAWCTFTDGFFPCISCLEWACFLVWAPFGFKYFVMVVADARQHQDWYCLLSLSLFVLCHSIWHSWYSVLVHSRCVCTFPAYYILDKSGTWHDTKHTEIQDILWPGSLRHCMPIMSYGGQLWVRITAVHILHMPGHVIIAARSWCHSLCNWWHVSCSSWVHWEL